ncbi:VWA domain-containing protein [Leptospira sp. 2 VSF19]|uniref:VWA domain-containing protein n=1 Tax=Leptospira soteropolitanensis TaxID=2950025 RepID=A0AAW5VEY3_9LEPT|nr:VWA domain-containing protein [Leptospira soteropolitanensis]MCW7492715.1 VWA domain-containing protein [Leptospira soteropolitanensis]MCW7500398.1 VWA domain-containing protein [Leptospira soteropolitanensis]MCW7522567.1 VWA domain-containing protein [Leptospira soteropolitanensis]MCW7526423.1 VWA domain-containing protein [Leptospira soteropolitanensis]MCW7530368.1 VWA domain-containing protein [Leptospira soteropolitanensis]
MDQFQRPYLLLLILPFLLLALYQWRKKPIGSVLLIQSDRFRSQNNNFFLRTKIPFLKITEFLIYVASIFLIIAAAGPGKKYHLMPDITNGIDIMIALDISGSMVNSYDFLPKNRLTVSKELLRDFIKKRVSDRIGIVLFAGAAYLQSPLSNDRYALDELIAEASDEDISEQGTAVGDALVLSTYRLKDSAAKSKIIILLTDGVSNTGKLDPETASQAAKAFGIKVYCIGIGKEQGQYEVNYESLEEISQNTSGRFFRAESPEVLQEVLNEINGLERVELPSKPMEIQETNFPTALSYFFGLLGIVGLFMFYPLTEKL